MYKTQKYLNILESPGRKLFQNNLNTIGVNIYSVGSYNKS